MKRFFDIVSYSLVIAFFFGWAYCFPLYFLVPLVCTYWGIDLDLSRQIAAALSGAIAVGIGGAFHEREICDLMEKKIASAEMIAKNTKAACDNANKEQTHNLEMEIARLREENQTLSQILRKTSKELDDRKTFVKDFAADTAQSSPWMALKISDAAALVDGELIHQLRTKKNPALRASEQIQDIAREKRNLLRRNKELEYQLQFYEGLFPWLEEFKTLPAPEAVQYVHSVDGDYDSVRSWLSPEEYAKLSAAQRNQLALDRYVKRKKSDWDVGIEYERYVGFLYERAGYHVIYNGASQGLSDMGRDIIADNGKATLVIQCKRWAREKEIHEKHIFQLFGTTVLLRIEKGTRCVGMFVTTAKLSVLARKCADFLGIKYSEGFEYRDYPLIKCNISKTGEKIYHLPFDQQYDRVQIAGKKGSAFAWTVAEAEDAGFRRAKRWIPDQFS